jgi:hypothetical protein
VTKLVRFTLFKQTNNKQRKKPTHTNKQNKPNKQTPTQTTNNQRNNATKTKQSNKQTIQPIQPNVKKTPQQTNKQYQQTKPNPNKHKTKTQHILPQVWANCLLDLLQTKSVRHSALQQPHRDFPSLRYVPTKHQSLQFQKETQEYNKARCD